MNYGYHQSGTNMQPQNYPTHYREYSYPAAQRRPESTFHGLVIGVHPKTGHYMVYSCICPELVEIRSTVPPLRIGSWIKIYVNCENFNADFILDETNSRGYTSPEILPDPRYTYARFFREGRGDDFRGEVLVTARFIVTVNREQNRKELQTFDIGNNLIDDANLIKDTLPYFEGRNFIVEAQASLSGFLVVAVHEDQNNQLRCDDLPDTIVPYDVRMLDDTPLMNIMTAGGNPPNLQPSTSYDQNQKKTSSQVSSQSSSEVFSSSSSFSQGQLAELQSETEPELQNIRYDTTADTTLTYITAKERMSGDKRPPVQEEGDDSDLEDDSRRETRGTKNIPSKKYIEDVSKRELMCLRMETALADETTTTALCTVVQKIDGAAILYTAKRDIVNVLLLENSCSGLDTQLKLGDVAFFEISARRPCTKDQLYPEAPYSHVAMRKKPLTEESKVKIDRFKKSVRTFGGLLEMKVTIPLMKGGKDHITERAGTDPLIEKEGGVYCMMATNGVLVNIPKTRIAGYLNREWKANFDLVAWAVYRRDYMNVCLHVGFFGEAFRRDKNGRLEELPFPTEENIAKMRR